MSDYPVARSAAKRVRKAFKRIRAYGGLLNLRCRNLLVSEPVTGTADVVVSMTSYGARLRTVDVALESIARGTVKPRRLILWLDDTAAFEQRTPALLRLQRRGLETRLSRNYGPHTKYFPYVESSAVFDFPLATADDDIIYPSRWLQALVEANQEHPDMVNGHWVRMINVKGGGITRYEDWTRRRDTGPGFNNFALGVSGVIYPPEMLRELRMRGDQFMDVCAGADDIWLHWVALRAGIQTRQVDDVARHFPMIPGSQSSALSDMNVGHNRNDQWIRALYSPSDLMALMTSGKTGSLKDGEGNAS
ncbi:hypothetical protein [Arthrobacter sp. S39]|uniref:hypothetical protein n=1 Tax=Arthrobacter sp. S39 TaxID=2509720 RepID=UPI001038170E|nr:hypothetical protein [Arthrobacter sp. S39]TAP44406.1 hypothetical protein EYS21_07785 [Arthrobacter sp. S39]